MFATHQLERETIYTVMLMIYVVGVTYAGKYIYKYMVHKGMSREKAFYYIRKFIHVLGAGVVTITIPFLFSSPYLPFIASMILAGTLFYLKRTNKMFYWFQSTSNSYEINFALAWGFGLLVSWIVTNNPTLAILPPLYISLGDGITGTIRNLFFSKRTKHWIGNLAMAIVIVPIGFLIGGLIGLVSAIASSIAEKFEFPPIDDNILISLTATFIISASFLL